MKVIEENKKTNIFVAIGFAVTLFILKCILGNKRKNKLLLKVLEDYHKPKLYTTVIWFKTDKKKDNINLGAINAKTMVMKLAHNVSSNRLITTYFHECRHLKQFESQKKIDDVNKILSRISRLKKLKCSTKAFEIYWNAHHEVDARRAEKVFKRKFLRYATNHPIKVIKSLFK